MPLQKSKSKRAFEHNLKAELAVGKPKDQSLAIAYSIRRKAPKKMAAGGKIKTLTRPSTIPFYKGEPKHVTGEGQEFEIGTPKDGRPKKFSGKMYTVDHETGEMEMHGPKKGKLQGLAEGGPISAKSESRASIDEQDMSELSRHRGNKPPHNDSVTDTPTRRQAAKGPRTTPIKHPSMAQSPVFKVKLRDQEDHLQDDGITTSEHDEVGPDRQGPKVRDMQDEHSTGRKPYAKGGEIRDNRGMRKYQAQSAQEKGVHTARNIGGPDKERHGESSAGYAARASHSSNPDIKSRDLKTDKPRITTAKDFGDQAKREHSRVMEESRSIQPKLKGLAKGGEVESSDYDHPLDGRYEDDLLDLGPSHDEGEMMADEHDEEGQDRQGPSTPSLKMKMMARGGEVSPHDEEEMEHEDSIAAAIMARRDRLHAEIDSGSHDLDSAVRMAEGGEVDGLINGMDSIYAHPNEDQADLSRNAEEDANMEDQSSFNALRKENYSESDGLDDLDSPEDSNTQGHKIDSDDHDMVEKIRRSMVSKRQFKAR